MQCCLMTIKEKYLAWRLEHQLHFVVRVGVDLHLHRVHALVYIGFSSGCFDIIGWAAGIVPELVCWWR